MHAGPEPGEILRSFEKGAGIVTVVPPGIRTPTPHSDRFRRWLTAVGASVALAGLGLTLWVHLKYGGSILASREEFLEICGVALATLGIAAYGWGRHAADIRALRLMRLRGSELRLLAGQVPASVWTTDTGLRLTSVFGSLIQRLEKPEARVPGHTLYDLFGTTDPAHPVIAAHLRALQGESATYERVAGEIVLEGCVEPLRDNRGRVIGCVGTAMDVSTWRWAESQVRRFGALVESSRDTIVTTDSDGTVQTWNHAAERLYGYSAQEATGRSLSLVYPPHSSDELRRNLGALARGESIEPYDTERVRKDGTVIAVSVTISPIKDGAGRIVGLSGIARDITERKRAEEALRQSEAMFRLMTENSTDIISRHAPDGTFLYVSPACRRLLGYDAEELVGRSPYDFFHPDDAAAATPSQEALHAKSASYAGTFRFRRKDGAYVWLEALGHGECDPNTGAVAEIHAASRDVTDRRRVEEQLRQSEEQLRALAQHLESAREEEHARMARKIHDELAQALTALRLDLSWLARKVPDSGAALRAKIVEMVALTDATIDAGRRIVAELRPPILENLGLGAAVEWLVERLAGGAGLSHEVDAGLLAGEIEPELAVAAYRVVQEAVTNVIRHAQAVRVRVSLATRGGALVLQVTDDGRGIRPDRASAQGSFGLIGMRERVLAHGGTLDIRAGRAGGTIVSASIPLHHADARMSG